MNRNYTIDLIRLIASFFILSLHTELPNFNIELGSYIRLAGRWAVPFFFITTGYFIGKKITADNILSFTNIQKNFIELISIFLVASAIYFAWTWAISEFWFFNQTGLFFWGGYWHLWFISAMIFGYFVIWYFYAINQSKLLPTLSIILLIIALYSDSYD
ncbi:MAG: acyltransferase family protein, partial [Bacteroidota bacterium]